MEWPFKNQKRKNIISVSLVFEKANFEMQITQSLINSIITETVIIWSIQSWCF